MRDPNRRRGHFPPMLAVLTAGGILTMVGLTKATEVLGAAAIPIWAMVLGAAVYIFRGPFGEAVLHSISQMDQDRELPATDPNVLAELDELRNQVAEMQERLDFTERLIAQQRDARPLGAGDRP